MWRIEHLETRVVLSAYTPAQVAHAYGFDQINFSNGSKGDGTGQTIAIVDAYHDANIFKDVDSFISRTGMGGGNAASFLTQANLGPVSAPINTSWGLETALDVEWAHAVAPASRILLVEAKSSGLNDMFDAVRYAAAQPNVSVVSMSWGTDEFSTESKYDSVFTTPAGHSGVTFVASSGDDGTLSYPATSSNVVSVGGTALRVGSGNVWSSETAWAGSGGGTSRFEPKPTYQSGVNGGNKRTNPDVAYNADPNTGFLVTNSWGQMGTWQVGGTSAGAPQWAALVAIANQGREIAGNAALAGTEALSALYSLSRTDYHDITSGGTSRNRATTGYDTVTGLGAPKADLIVADLVNWVPGSKSATATTGSVGTKTTNETIYIVIRRWEQTAETDSSVVAIASSTTVSGATSTSPAANGLVATGERTNVPTNSATGTTTTVTVVATTSSNGSGAQSAEGDVSVNGLVEVNDVGHAVAPYLALSPADNVVPVASFRSMSDTEFVEVVDATAALDATFADFDSTAVLLDDRSALAAVFESSVVADYSPMIAIGISAALGGYWLYGRSANSRKKKLRLAAPV